MFSVVIDRDDGVSVECIVWWMRVVVVIIRKWWYRMVDTNRGIIRISSSGHIAVTISVVC